jgi:5'-nucleotidase (lipoprotein e(P4) family)
MKKQHSILLVAIAAVAGVSGYFAGASAFAGDTPKEAWKTSQYQLGGALYMQKAAEYRALAYQAFNIARMSLDTDEKTRKHLPKPERKKPCAVMVDIDETVLDNSPFQAVSIKGDLPFDLKRWYAWGDMRAATAIPGASDFLNYTAHRKCRVFYSSNRDEVQKAATIDNLRSVGFPDVSDETVLLRIKESSKEPRRKAVSAKYRIVLLMGDNLIDFAGVFDGKNVADRFAETDNARAMFGTKWIVLPNAMYGDWENALYDYKHLTPDQKADIRRDSLRGY